MENVLEEDVMVKPIDDMNNYRRQGKTQLVRPSAFNKASHWISDNVTLSHASKQMEALKALILSDPEMQANRIAFIKEAIAEGRYEIDSQKITEKMLADILPA